MEVEYENLLDFCVHLYAVGHSLATYRKNPINNFKADSTKVVKEKPLYQVYQKKKQQEKSNALGQEDTKRNALTMPSRDVMAMIILENLIVELSKASQPAYQPI